METEYVSSDVAVKLEPVESSSSTSNSGLFNIIISFSLLLVV